MLEENRMTHVKLDHPECFNFKKPEEWQRWKRRFEQFRVASGLKEASAAKQVSTLLYCMGDDSEAVLSSTNPTEDDRKTYDVKFDSFFCGMPFSSERDSIAEASWKVRRRRNI